MRVAVVAESFLPLVNGVTRSVERVCEQLGARGHDVLVVAPGGPGVPQRCAGATVLQAPSVPLPGYPGVRVGRPWRGLAPALAAFGPDVVHLAGPLVLGAHGGAVARRLGLPAVAVHQTDLPAYARHYGLGSAGSRAAWRWVRRVHADVDVTLAPSRAAVAALQEHGVPRVHRWPRGVDLQRFSPRHRDEALRAALAPDGARLVGYVGRLAAEKELELLRAVHDLPGTRLVLVGNGPRREALARLLPGALLLGQRTGEQLSRLVASLDVFVHPGRSETFGQAVQEALASGVPVVGVAAGGVLDLVRPGRTGLLFPPGDGDALRAAVAALLAEPERAAALRRTARRSVRGRSWEVVTDLLLDHYARAGAPAAPVLGRTA